MSRVWRLSGPADMRTDRQGRLPPGPHRRRVFSRPLLTFPPCARAHRRVVRTRGRRPVTARSHRLGSWRQGGHLEASCHSVHSLDFCEDRALPRYLSLSPSRGKCIRLAGCLCLRAGASRHARAACVVLHPGVHAAGHAIVLLHSLPFARPRVPWVASEHISQGADPRSSEVESHGGERERERDRKKESKGIIPEGRHAESMAPQGGGQHRPLGQDNSGSRPQAGPCARGRWARPGRFFASWHISVAHFHGTFFEGHAKIA